MVIHECGYCARQFIGTPGRKFCTPTHGTKAHLQADRDRRRGTRKTNQRSEQIFRTTIFIRDEWMCGICDTPVDPTISAMQPMGPTLDHVMPLARGGSHTEGNVQLAHRICNMRKSARVAA